MILRPYQSEAVEAVYRYLRTKDGNPAVVIPTGGGKTPVIATICRDAVSTWGGRVLIVTHVKELIEQSCQKLLDVCPEIGFGVYSAGLGRRDKDYACIVAGIQSVYKRACELGAFDLILCDECHLIPEDGEGMYRQFFTDAKIVNNDVRIVGLTATPYRMSSGLIVGTDRILSDICYEIGVKELIRDGYLCHLVSKNAKNRPSTAGLHVRAGEFVKDEVEKLWGDDNDDPLLIDAIRELVEYTQDRRGVLIFAAGIEHGQRVALKLKWEHGIECGFVCGDKKITSDAERAETLAGFKRQDLRYLCNVNVLTTGFDATHIDCVALLRPTLSAGLYYQMVGRGFRLHEGKKDCLVLDFGGNILRHGPVDAIKVRSRPGGGSGGEAPAKECPQCRTVVAAGYGTCPECGHEFPARENVNRHESEASGAGVLSGQVTDETFTVEEVSYSVHKKRGAPDDAPRTLRVDYRVGFHVFKSEWICFEHSGFAKQRAWQWWAKRTGDPMPATSAAALAFINEIGIAEPKTITVRSVAGEQFERIIGYDLPAQAEETLPTFAPAMAEEEIPF